MAEENGTGVVVQGALDDFARIDARGQGGRGRMTADIRCPVSVVETAARISCTSTVPFREEAGLEIVRTAGQRRKPAV
jgi:hypothetical protein